LRPTRAAFLALAQLDVRTADTSELLVCQRGQRRGAVDNKPLYEDVRGERLGPRRILQTCPGRVLHTQLSRAHEPPPCRDSARPRRGERGDGRRDTGGRSVSGFSSATTRVGGVAKRRGSGGRRGVAGR